MTTLIIILIGLFLILKFWRSLLLVGIIGAIGLFLVTLMGISNVWLGIDADTVLKAVIIIVVILVAGSMFLGGAVNKILGSIFNLFK